MHTWIVCGLCGAVVADAALHAVFHGVSALPSIEPSAPEEASHA